MHKYKSCASYLAHQNHQGCLCVQPKYEAQIRLISVYFCLSSRECRWLKCWTLSSQVTFFQQDTLPCVSDNGRFIMETPYRVPSLNFMIHSSDHIRPGGRIVVYCNLISKLTHGVRSQSLNANYFNAAQYWQPIICMYFNVLAFC